VHTLLQKTNRNEIHSRKASHWHGDHHWLDTGWSLFKKSLTLTLLPLGKLKLNSGWMDVSGDSTVHGIVLFFISLCGKNSS
jgi:hypothetical protein